jgi:hypothetical protein
MSPYFVGLLAVLAYLGLGALAGTGKGGLFRVINGEDGRLSTSKFQFFLWTGVVIFAYAALFVRRCAQASCDPSMTFPDNVLLAMGFSVVTLATAKGITTSYINSGRLVKSSPKGSPNFSDLVTDDEGRPDLGKIQMLAWTFVAVAAYLYTVVGAVGSTESAKWMLPDIDRALMILMGIGQGAYLGAKIVTSKTMKIFNLEPPRAAINEKVKINGQNFGNTTGSVVFGDVAAAIDLPWTDTAVTFTVPPQKANGDPFKPGDTEYVGVLLQGTVPGETVASPTVPFTIAPSKPMMLDLLVAPNGDVATLPGGLVVYTCAAWGARPPRHDFASTTPTAMVLHHMDYPNRDPIADHALAVKAAFEVARTCQNDHMDDPKKQWADTGQHFTVSIDGIVCEGRHGSVAALLADQAHCIRGSHAADPDVGVDYNNSWGTEHEGTYDTAHMPTAQWNASVQLHAAIALLCKLDSATILGHRDTGINTDCPGNWFEAQIPRFRQDVHNAVVRLRQSLRADPRGLLAGAMEFAAWPAESDDPELLAQLELIRSRYLSYIQEGVAKYGFSESLIAGVGSRESHWGRILQPPGPGGTGDFTPRHGKLPPDGKGYGRGLMQIDYDAHEFAKTGPWADPRENILYACDVLSGSQQVIADKTGLTGVALLRAAVAGYNAGPTTVANDVNAGRDPDTHTAHRDYSANVLELAAWFKEKGLS